MAVARRPVLVSTTPVPFLTLNFPSGARSTVKVQPSHISKISDATRAAHIRMVLLLLVLVIFAKRSARSLGASPRFPDNTTKRGLSAVAIPLHFGYPLFKAS
jgi:hypothetical protein